MLVRKYFVTKTIKISENIEEGIFNCDKHSILQWMNLLELIIKLNEQVVCEAHISIYEADNFGGNFLFVKYIYVISRLSILVDNFR